MSRSVKKDGRLYWLTNLRSGRDSVGVKVFMVFVGFLVLVSMTFTLLFVYHFGHEMRRDLMEKGRAVATMMATSLRTGVFAENRELINDIVKGGLSHSEVISVAVWTREGKILVAQGKNDADHERAMAGFFGQDNIEFVEPVVIEQAAAPEELMYFGAKEVKAEPLVIGYVKVGMDTDALNWKIAASILSNTVIALLFIVSGSFFLLATLKKILTPLDQLTAEVRRIGEEGEIGTVTIRSGDEIGRLASAFNTMSENLRKREEEARHLQMQLRHAQTMEAIGTLARGVAHDFNNILATIQASLYIIRKRVEEEHPLRRFVDRIDNSVTRAQALIQSLLTFSKGQTVRRYPLELNGLISKLEPTIRDTAGDGVECRVELSPQSVTVMANSVQVEQILMNLVANARDAMPEGGVLTVSTADLGYCDNLSEYGLVAPGRFALITVSDTGHGMDAETRQRIFEPFYTTKEVGKGTGLGLSIVYGLIEQHAGGITVHSEEGKGTTFRICLPLAEKGEKADVDGEREDGEDTDR